MKHYIVTGAGKGLGFETTKQLLSEGHLVTAISRNIEQLSAIQNGNLKVLKADITTDIKKIIDFIDGTKIDGLLNNAGVLVKNDIHKLTIEDFNFAYVTNAYAPIKLSIELIRNFNKDAHILNIGSMGGYQDTSKFPGMIFYSSSKAALHCMTQCLALELKEFNINVNCLSIGAVDTEMVKQAFPGFQAPISAANMAQFVSWFVVNGAKFFNAQIIPVQLNNM